MDFHQSARALMLAIGLWLPQAVYSQITKLAERSSEMNLGAIRDGQVYVFSGGLFVTVNSGTTWDSIQTPSSMFKGIFSTNREIFLQTLGGLFPIGEAGGPLDSIPCPECYPGVSITKIVATKKQLYLTNYGGLLGAKHGAFWVASREKMEWVRKEYQSFFEIEFAAHGDTVLMNAGSLLYSTDAGSTWDTVKTMANMEVQFMGYSGGHFVVASEQGLFRSSNPIASWQPAGFNSGRIRNLQTSGPNILAQNDASQAFLSRNAGESWSAINFRFPSGPITKMALSDSLACFSGASATENSGIYCGRIQDLPLQQVGIRPRTSWPGRPNIVAAGRSRYSKSSRIFGQGNPKAFTAKGERLDQGRFNPLGH